MVGRRFRWHTREIQENPNKTRACQRRMPIFEADMGPTPSKVAILGGDPVISGSLEALLQTAGYRTWSLPEARADEIDAVFPDTQLLIVAPAPSAKFRKILLNT